MLWNNLREEVACIVTAKMSRKLGRRALMDLGEKSLEWGLNNVSFWESTVSFRVTVHRTALKKKNATHPSHQHGFHIWTNCFINWLWDVIKNMVSGTSNLMLPCSTCKSKQLPRSKTEAKLNCAVRTKSNDYKCCWLKAKSFFSITVQCASGWSKSAGAEGVLWGWGLNIIRYTLSC